MSKYTTPAQRIAELVAEHGSYRKAAKAIGCSHPYLIASTTGRLMQAMACWRNLGFVL